MLLRKRKDGGVRIMNEFETQSHFAMEKGKRDSDRLVEECFSSVASLLTGHDVTIAGRKGRLVVLGGKTGEYLMVDIRFETGSPDHIEFTVRKTGWGGALSSQSTMW